MITTARCAINGLRVMEVSVNNMPDMESSMTAVYALLGEQMSASQKVTYTHGKCSAYPDNWSKDTLELLKDLIKSMEADLLPRHFETGNQEESDERLGSERLEETPQI